MKKLIRWQLLLAAGFLLLVYSCEKEEQLTSTQGVVNLPSDEVLQEIAATAEWPFEVSDEELAEVESRSEVSLIEYLSFKPEFSILLRGINRLPGLALLLDNPFLQITLFAPENSSFTTYLTAKGYASIDDVPLTELNQLISYHLLLGRIDLVRGLKEYNSTMAYAEGRNGGRLEVYANVLDPRNATLNGTATITRSNLFVGRTLVHVIDEVMAVPNVSNFLKYDPDFSMFAEALSRPEFSNSPIAPIGQGDFITALSESGSFTIFAPTNAAFQALLDSSPGWNSVHEIPIETLETLLKYHIVSGRNIPLHHLSGGTTFTTLATDANGKPQSLTSSVSGRSIQLTAGSNTGQILSDLHGEIQGNNGVIHAVNKVLLP